MKIFILRHGEAGASSISDFDRELTEAGETDSRTIGTYCLKAKIHFTHVLVSPITRARQTARTMMEQLPAAPIEETDFLTPDADPKNLFNHLRSFTNESRILCVTHEPFASTCISMLISGTETSHVVMKTASFACVETVGAPSRGNGKLHWLVNPEMIQSVVL
ncbi:MAG: phosphohistidine phosphatase SixA [Ignavibacteriales bacterium]|nr:phosphohistidine phosphatase SixA [Ignavibacteriales bacterium]